MEKIRTLLRVLLTLAIGNLTYIDCSFVLYVCLVGTNVDSPTSLHNVQVCGINEHCYLEQYITPLGLIKYNAGCIKPSLCPSSSTAGSNIPVCSQCCEGDLCATKLCGQSGYVNVDGPVCYDCASPVSSPELCGTITQCRRGQVCGAYKNRQGQFILQCMDSLACDQERYTSTCSQCCSAQLCNTQCADTGVQLSSICTDDPNCQTLLHSYQSLHKDLCSDSSISHFCNQTCGLCPTTSTTVTTSMRPTTTSPLPTATSTRPTTTTTRPTTTTSRPTPTTTRPTTTTSRPTPTTTRPTPTTTRLTTTTTRPTPTTTRPTTTTTRPTTTTTRPTATTQRPTTTTARPTTTLRPTFHTPLTTLAPPLLTTQTSSTDVCNDHPDCAVLKATVAPGPSFCPSLHALVYFCNKTCGICQSFPPTFMPTPVPVTTTTRRPNTVYLPTSTAQVTSTQEQCVINPCRHGLCYVAHNGTYICACTPGFGGQYCEIAQTVDSCNIMCMHGTCLAHGHHHNHSGYTCTCDSGYVGQNCDKRITDCSVVQYYDTSTSTSHDGVYSATVGGQSVSLYCDLTTDGGGWTVMLRRNSSVVDFSSEDIVAYSSGFGDINGNFWLGLEKVHELTSDGRRYMLRVDIETSGGGTYFETYEDFFIGPGKDYALRVGRYSGTAGDSLSGHNGFSFSTSSADYDSNHQGSCALYLHGAWWFHNCADSCLTCEYMPPGISNCRAMSWNSLNYCTALKAAKMMFRPI